MGNKLRSPVQIGHLSLSDSSADDYLYVQGIPIKDLDLENGEGVNSLQQKQSDKDVEFENPYYTPHYTYEIGAFGKDSIMLNGNSMTQGELSTAIGRNTLAEGARSFASGTKTAAVGNNSHAEGLQTYAGGSNGAHAEGNQTGALGSASHAEGNNTQARGDAAHAEGTSTKAIGNYSHAGGRSSEVTGEGAFVHGRGLYLNQLYQAAFGKYNNPLASLLFCVGNGTSDELRSNAFEVIDNGIARAYADKSLITGANDLITKGFADTEYSANYFATSSDIDALFN